MNVDTWLKTVQSKMEKSGIGTARLDVLVLLEDATGKDRAWLLAHPNESLQQHLQGASLKVLNRQVEMRAQHVPLAYVRGKTEFFGREFIVNEHVLVPRPESETMIELLKASTEQQPKNTFSRVVPWKLAQANIIDVGCGSGALGITAKLEIPESVVTLIDIDAECLGVAQKNAQKHDAKVKFLHGDLLEPLHDSQLSIQNTVILANLPYVPDDHALNQAAMNEPRLAIFGGPDGLDLYRKMFIQLKEHTQLQNVKYVFTESLPFQHKELTQLAKVAGYTQTTEQDFIQVFERR